MSQRKIPSNGTRCDTNNKICPRNYHTNGKCPKASNFSWNRAIQQNFHTDGDTIRVGRLSYENQNGKHIKCSVDTQRTFDAVKERYSAYFDGKDGIPASSDPAIYEDDDGHEIVSWEAGPDGWAHQFVMGGHTEESMALASEADITLGAAKPPVDMGEVEYDVNTSSSIIVY